MGWGILEAKKPVVRGTIQLFDIGRDHEATAGPHIDSSALKHSKSGVILNPQPSDSPNDPYNWRKWHRYFNVIQVATWTSVALVHMAILGPSTVDLATQFNKSVVQIGYLTSDLFLVSGLAAYPLSIVSRIVGKRSVFVLGAVSLLVSDIWAAEATSYNSLRGARILSGIGCGLFECTGLMVIPDLLHVHERAGGIAIFTVGIQVGGSASAMICTQIITRWSLKRAFVGLIITEVIMLICFFLTFWEPVYHRDPDRANVLAHQLEQPLAPVDTNDGSTNEKDLPAHTEAEPIQTSSQTSSQTSPRPPPPKKTFLQQMKLWEGLKTKQNPLNIIWGTFALTFHPTILVIALGGLSFASVSTVAYIIALTLFSPPYSFSANAVSNMYAAPLIASFIAWPINASLDPFIKWMSRHNNMIYEPEFRLWYIWPSMITWIIGWVGWGWGVQEQIPWYGLAIFFGIFVGSVCVMNTALVGYILDAHPEYSNESQIILFAVKNIWSFGVGYYWVDWYMAKGAKYIYGISSIYMVGVLLLTIPLYIFGKRLRLFWSEHPFLGISNMGGCG